MKATRNREYHVYTQQFRVLLLVQLAVLAELYNVLSQSRPYVTQELITKLKYFSNKPYFSII